MTTGARWATSLPFWGLPQVSPPQPGMASTFGANFALETGFVAVQLLLVNGSSSPQKIGGALVAPSAFAKPFTTPLDAAGRPVAWRTVTVNGDPTPVLPAAQSPGVPSVTLSDVIRVESQARADGGRLPLLFTRFLSFQNAAWRAGLAANEMFERHDRQSGGRGVKAYCAMGDFLHEHRDSLAEAFVVPDIFYTAIAGVRFLAKDHCITLLSCGDSLTCGTGTLSDHAGFGMLAAKRLSGPECFVSHAAHGWPGQGVEEIVANAVIMLDLAPPDVITCVIDSPNDYTWITENAEGCRLAQQDAIMALVRMATARGVLVVLLTPIPFAGYDLEATYGVQRLQSGAFVRGLLEPCVLTLDAQTLLSSQAPEAGGSPVLPPHLRAFDEAHLNDAGHEILAEALSKLLAAHIA